MSGTEIQSAGDIVDMHEVQPAVRVGGNGHPCPEVIKPAQESSGAVDACQSEHHSRSPLGHCVLLQHSFGCQACPPALLLRLRRCVFINLAASAVAVDAGAGCQQNSPRIWGFREPLQEALQSVQPDGLP
ncbi:MAG: hypothetical protein RLZZ436_2062 [Planctomycetota bacterium]